MTAQQRRFRSRSSRFMVAIIAIAGWQACFKVPQIEPENLTCRSSQNCPEGYSCSALGTCTRGAADAGGASEVLGSETGPGDRPLLADGSAGVDGVLPVIDGSRSVDLSVDISAEIGSDGPAGLADLPITSPETGRSDTFLDAPTQTGGIDGAGGVAGTGGSAGTGGAVSGGGGGTGLAGTGGATGTGTGGAVGSGGVGAGGSPGSGGIAGMGGSAETGGAMGGAGGGTGLAGTGSATGTGGAGGSGGVGAGGNPGTGGSFPGFAIASFTASPSAVTAGNSTTLRWAVTGATALTIDPVVGVVTGTTSKAVTPEQTTIYTLTAVGPGGAILTAQAQVTVVAMPEISSFVAQPAIISTNASASLIPVFSGGTAATISHGFVNVTSGSMISTGPLTATTTYTLTVSNSLGDSVTKDLTVTVVPRPVIVNFTTGATTLSPGSSTTLTATFAGGSGTIDHNLGSVTSGTPVSTGGLVASTTYTLTVTNAAGDVTTHQVTVAVEGFMVTGPLTTARYSHTATLLASGKVLVAGGYNGAALDSAELYDPTSGVFTPVANAMKVARYQHTATLLASGKVLIAGGYNRSSLDSAEIYDPAGGSNGNFTLLTNKLTAARYRHAAAALPSLGTSGKVLLAGGNWSQVAELYDAYDGTFTALSQQMVAGRQAAPTATNLANGKVLLFGGSATVPAELFDPATGAFGEVAYSVPVIVQGLPTATLLSNGKVLLAGGISDAGVQLNNTELYDPNGGSSGLGSVSEGAYMLASRAGHTAVRLTNGKVLLAGGTDANTAEVAAATGSSFATVSMIAPRTMHTATLLNDGRVLLVGGIGSTSTNTAELYVY